MKRIILTVTTDLTYDQRMQRIAGSLQTAGYSVLLVGRRKKQSVAMDKQAYRQKRFRCFFEKGKFFYLEYNIRLFFFLLFRPADIFCAIDLDTIGPVTMVGRLRRKERVYDAHEYFTETPEVTDRPQIKRIWEWIARQCIPHMAACYTVGPRLAEIMSEHYGRSFGVVRNLPLRTEMTATAGLRKAGLILYQGALNEGRGLEAAIEAMSLLPQEIQLWLAGEGDLSEVLREQVRMANLEERVQFLGYVKPARLRSITPQAWLGLNLLENKGLSYYYSLANKAFDYVQAGIPSLQMDFPEYRALQEENACFELVQELSAEAVAGAVLQFWHDPDKYHACALACRQAASIWTWEEEEKKLLSIYQQL